MALMSGRGVSFKPSFVFRPPDHQFLNPDHSVLLSPPTRITEDDENLGAGFSFSGENIRNDGAERDRASIYPEL